MTKTLLLFFTVLSATTMAHSQSFSSTPVWDFITENYAFTGSTQVQITKTEKSGKLQLSVEATDTSFKIAGTLYIDLADNTVIVCTDKGANTTDGNRLISQYLLTNAEMSRLRKTDIQSIRFSIKGKKKRFSSQTGYFTAINKKTYFATAYDRSKKSHDTAAALHLLYN